MLCAKDKLKVSHKVHLFRSDRIGSKKLGSLTSSLKKLGGSQSSTNLEQLIVSLPNGITKLYQILSARIVQTAKTPSQTPLGNNHTLLCSTQSSLICNLNAKAIDTLCKVLMQTALIQQCELNLLTDKNPEAGQKRGPNYLPIEKRIEWAL